MNVNRPKRPGWFWFLPDEDCPSPTGLLRLDRPVIVLVGQERYSRDGPSGRLVVRFSADCEMFVDDMSGEWAHCKTPKRLERIAMKRIMRKRRHDAKNSS